ncbi:MAG: M55 family metallopeptidase [Candidatus Omnitrophica bacterium]|nr:M55 family metallopeptidase [Candidatus Omnitrophota bacterium]MCM8817606.1 M55 family metallopeptidase [Candidatus Omnitrophota bacterium]
MKIYIIPDLEGISGVTQFRQNLKTMGIYETMCRRMVKEINAVVKGIKEADETSQIYVMETHEIDDELLSYEVFGLIKGAKVPLFDESFHALFFVGQHAKSQEEKGVLSHTGNARIMDVRVNDVSYGELGLCSILAGIYDISTVFVSGDSACVEEAKKLFNNIITVETKIGLGMHSAVCYHISKVLKQLQERSKEAVMEFKNNPHNFSPLKIPPPYKFEVEWQYVEMADRASLIPGVKKLSGRTTVFVSDNFEQVYRCYVAQAQIALAGYI